LIANQFRSLPDDSKPLLLPAKIDLTTRPKVDPALHMNGHAAPATNGTIGKRKRDADEVEPEDDNVRKRGKVFEEKPPQTDDDVVILDDSDQGAIVIDDD
jgi:ubiquitin-like 1-activating enzyme E1 B